MAQQTPPDPQSYRFVMATWREYDPRLERLASTYDEATQSRDIEHPDGRRRPTIFLNTPQARDALRMRGWEDVTEPWFRAHPDADPDLVPTSPATPPEPPAPAASKKRVTLGA